MTALAEDVVRHLREHGLEAKLGLSESAWTAYSPHEVPLYLDAIVVPVSPADPRRNSSVAVLHVRGGARYMIRTTDAGVFS